MFVFMISLVLSVETFVDILYVFARMLILIHLVYSVLDLCIIS